MNYNVFPLIAISIDSTKNWSGSGKFKNKTVTRKKNSMGLILWPMLLMSLIVNIFLWIQKSLKEVNDKMRSFYKTKLKIQH